MRKVNVDRMRRYRERTPARHWPTDVKDTYLGMIYVCSSCEWRLTECKCPHDAPGRNHNRYPMPVDAGLYALGPTLQPPSSFVLIEAAP